ncbi:MAG: hypothetical protein ATN35_07650 [Epulopiscium sp. Nele67-Bin004]|nr:MAG: hypothetical protein ATN35_07650 [Epulopiscium sp. Nele67-Bin004]
MNYFDVLKNYLPHNDAKESIEKLCNEVSTIYISVNSDTACPKLEFGDYMYYNDKHILMLSPASIFVNQFVAGTKFSGILPGQGKGLKFMQRISGVFECQDIDKSFLEEMAQGNMMVKKMMAHGGKFFALKFDNVSAYLSPAEMYNVETNLQTSFAEVTLDGRKRYEHSRHVLMTYNNRNVIFSVIVEDGVYYTLTKADTEKVSYIKDGGVCEFFDGKNTHFTGTISILDDSKVDEIFNKLEATNNGYFKDKDNLLALSFINN